MMHHINTIDQPPRHHGPGPGRYGEADDGGFLLLLLIIIIRSPPLIPYVPGPSTSVHVTSSHHTTLRTLFISRRQCSNHLPRSEKARHSVIKGDTRHRGHHPPPVLFDTAVAAAPWQSSATPIPPEESSSSEVMRHPSHCPSWPFRPLSSSSGNAIKTPKRNISPWRVYRALR